LDIQPGPVVVLIAQAVEVSQRHLDVLPPILEVLRLHKNKNI
jgi:hypothetical protein